MAKKVINVGTVPNDGTGDSIRAAFIKVNEMTDEVYGKLDEFGEGKADVAAVQAALNLKASKEELETGLGGKADAVLTPPGIGAVPVAIADLLTGSRVSVAWFGAHPSKTAAQNDSAFQACFDYCRDNDKVWLIPAGSFKVNSVTAYTGGICHGELVAVNNGSPDPVVLIAPKDSDITTIDLATVNAWTGIVKGNDKSADFAPYYGCTVWWHVNDQKWINRQGNSGLTLSEAIVVHDPDGSFYPPIWGSKAVPWTSAEVKAVRNRPTITVGGLKVRFTSGTGERNCGVQITRPNTTLIDPSVINGTSSPIQQGFAVSYTSGVTVIDGYVEGARENVTNYGYNSGTCVNTTFINCREIFCRRGLDNHAAKLTKVIGGSYPDGLGAHWVNGLDVDGPFISSDSPGAAPVFVAGANVSVRNSRIRLRSDSLHVVGVRSDLFELVGSLRIEDNDIELDCSASTSSARQIVLMNANTGAHDWGRVVYMPDLIAIRGNRIKQIGAGFASTIDLVRLFNNAATPPSGVSAGGIIKIDGNSFDFDAGLLNGSNPRIALVTFKFPMWNAGSGYTINASDLPTLQAYMYCDPSHPSPSSQRNDFYGRNIGTLLWQVNFGAFRWAEFDCQSMVNNFGLSRPGSGYATALGDEVETRTTQLYALTSFNPPSLAAGASTSTTVTVPGAKAGDPAVASLTSITGGGWVLSAQGTADNTVTVTLANQTGAVADLASGTLRVKVLKY